MFSFIANIFGYLLKWLYDIVGCNYGVALILFTILLRIILLPITIKQQQSTPIIQNTLLHPLPSYIGADSNPRNLSQDQGIDDTIHVLFNFSAF